ncbi:MAG: ABC transporter ATP-binding protein [Betaproteobacteria bacterium]|nr:ABC transporter ATP-binding protein [Betaproteobacteria bacterium]
MAAAADLAAGPAVGAPLVELRGVGRTYANGTCALEGVDLDLQRGEFLTLVGPSGCGKSTLLNLIAGLARPSSGRITWRDAADASIRDARPRIGFVFQSPTLMPWARLSTNVRLPLDLAGVARKAADRAVADALARVNLTGFARHLPRELSGGMQMRASIARALVTDPELLLMDEPFGALDEFTRQRLDAELLSLWSAQRFTVVFVTHSIQEAVFLSTRVAVMGARPGRILDVLSVAEPYPRDDAFRLTTAFAAHAQRLSSRIADAGAGELPDAAAGEGRAAGPGARPGRAPR